MKPYEKVKSRMVPLNVPNVDTDQIIPKQFLKRIERSGFGQFLFFDWRFQADGKENPDFVANKPEYKNAQILLARDNFGCGSSREHAPWALLDYGFKVIIAPSFADIFYNNCFQNGILPIKMSPEQVDNFFKMADNANFVEATVDLEKQEILTDAGAIKFEIDAGKKEKLLKGLDDISLTLQFTRQIAEYEKSHVIY
ncbi:MAG: 3-isopropylmalate dehydratase small subunit [Spirochaetia bacterium]|nr:3-isopropylmalate dehydratase small subunit [Spirochaetia bacterium]